MSFLDWKPPPNPLWEALSKRERERFFQLCHWLEETEFKAEMQAALDSAEEEFRRREEKIYQKVSEKVYADWERGGSIREEFSNLYDAIEKFVGLEDEGLIWDHRWPIQTAIDAIAYDIIMSEREGAEAA
jgi:hypothetical protein